MIYLGELVLARDVFPCGLSPGRNAETIRSVCSTGKSNPVLEPVLSRNWVSAVQITMRELRTDDCLAGTLNLPRIENFPGRSGLHGRGFDSGAGKSMK